MIIKFPEKDFLTPDEFDTNNDFVTYANNYPGGVRNYICEYYARSLIYEQKMELSLDEARTIIYEQIDDILSCFDQFVRKQILKEGAISNEEI
ncbi:MAG: hypothetical protein LBT06_10765 [Hungatella sp.]|jgi:hypothetical protein|nr:hypothetical protein [Hungatella sp.]